MVFTPPPLRISPVSRGRATANLLNCFFYIISAGLPKYLNETLSFVVIVVFMLLNYSNNRWSWRSRGWS